jgi:hypothetical protein
MKQSEESHYMFCSLVQELNIWPLQLTEMNSHQSGLVKSGASCNDLTKQNPGINQ